MATPPVAITTGTGTPADAESSLLTEVGGNGLGTATALNAHKVIISIGVLLLFVIIISEVSGISHEMAMICGFLLLSVVLILVAHSNPGSLGETLVNGQLVEQYPAS